MPESVVEIQDRLGDLEARLLTKHKHMASIYEITNAINTGIEVTKLYDYYKICLSSFLGIEDFVLYHYQDGWSIASSMQSMLSPEIKIDLPVALKYKYNSKIDVADIEKIGGYQYVLPVYLDDVAVSVALIGQLNDDGNGNEDYLIQYAQVITNIIVMAIENKRLLEKELEDNEMKKEMELASKIQGMLIPKKLPKNHLYEFAGLYLPHRNIGGDYYDVININKDEFIFCLGDISGKGVSAALVMANLQAYLNASPPIELDNGRALVDRLNEKILNITNGEKFITLFIAKYNLLTRELTYLNAGHNPPFLYNNGQLRRLDKGCALLGILEYIPVVHTERIKLSANSTVFCYTDGLTELENTSSEMFGEERLTDFIMENIQQSSDDLVKNLYSNLVDYKCSRDFTDDVSVLIGRFF
ncbi:MAG: PP2C family protein-serine/threonine phosphatase [Chitinophagales bacterium]|nr:PP2C family protein-serine/threonine phosphatase [Chitinophagales bacterium]MCZ2393032.1 PP2C family protein-serine/threonine phosphatase [Chitinophagales bacterium]